jgi:hypothetical protein
MEHVIGVGGWVGDTVCVGGSSWWKERFWQLRAPGPLLGLKTAISVGAS